MSVLEYIEEEEGFEIFYERFIDVKAIRNSEAQAHCPKHIDKKPSFNFNIDTGKWYCQSCGEGGHDPISFYKWLFNCDYADAQEELEALLGLTPGPTEDYKEYHKNLMKDSKALKYLKDRGLVEETIKKYFLGWDGKRFHYPVLDFGGNHRNTLKHKPNPKPGEPKSFSLFNGVGAVRLSPIRNVNKSEELWVMAGWGDCILANQNGLNAVTIVGAGEGTWHPRFNKYFEDKKVCICYDNDDAGKKGRLKVAKALLSVTDNVYVVSIPEDMKKGADFTDYLKEYSINDFLKLERVKIDEIEDTEENRVIQQVHLSETMNADLYNKNIRTTATITGKGDVYGVPSKVEYTCKQVDPDSPSCAMCNLFRHKGKMILKIKPYDTRNLELFRLNTSQQQNVLRRMAGLPKSCPKAQIKIKDMVNIEEANLVPEVDYSIQNSKSYLARSVYIVNKDVLDMNKPYIFEGTVIPNPSDQKSTILIYGAEATKGTIDSFEMTPVLYDRLKVFQANSVKEMNEVLKRKLEDYEVITGIYDRRLLLTAIDLVLHSPLSFVYRGRRIDRGYLNCLVFGDTATGKSSIVDSLFKHFKIGDMTDGENVSFAGLVGGVQQMVGNNKWGLSWNKIPQNDRGIVKIDEFHEMPDQDKKKMSQLMSTGIATIQKIASGETMARTRLILIANCKDGNISNYQFGCQAIPAIVGGNNEDVRRIDLAIGVSAEGMDLEALAEKQKQKPEPKVCTTDLCHSLVMWAWSRKYNDIIFTEGAESAITKYTKIQAKKYHIAIPLVQGIEHSIKLARLAAACAAQVFSTDEKGDKIIVQAIHVEMVYRFLEALYSNIACKYDVFSNQQYLKDNLINPSEIMALGITKKIANLLLNSSKFNRSMLEMIFGCEPDQAKLIIYKLLQNNAVEHYGTNLLKKTPAFIKFLSTETFPNKAQPMF